MRRSQNGNVFKTCDCKRQATCQHEWRFYYGTPPNRKRGSLDARLGKHAPDLTTAQRWFRDELLPQLTAPAGMAPAPAPIAEQTVRALLEEKARDRPSAAATYQVTRLCRTPVPGYRDGQVLGDWPASALTVAALKAFRRSRPKTAGDRDLAFVRKAYNDGILNGVITTTPFRVNGVATFGKLASDQRDRRLFDGEEAALLAACDSDDLRDVIVAAIATGARRGELSTVQVHEISFAPNRGILLPAKKTKTKKDRWAPISPELRAIIDRRVLGPDGKPLPPHAYVFGDATGQRVVSRKTAWRATVLRAHGHKPTYIVVTEERDGREHQKKRLSAASLEALDTIDLHFHDLRREGASRWLESGVVSLAQIQAWLGHANISQTSTYLRVAISDADNAMARYVEHRKTVAFDGIRTGGEHSNPPAPSETGTESPQKTSTIH